MTNQGRNGNAGNPNPLASVLTTAKMLGSSAAGSMVKAQLREKVVSILSEHDPDELRRYILVQYPLVANDTPEQVRNVLSNTGPQFEEDIREHVTPEKIMYWLEHPEEWMDEDDDKHEEVRRCAEVIYSTRGGEQWLTQQVEDLYVIAGIE